MTAVPATLRLRREGVLRSRAARGDATAFAAVYERHHQALYRYCRSILRHEEDAQDALQSTFDAGVRGAPGRAARLRAAAVAVPDRAQRGDLDPAPPARDVGARRRAGRATARSRTGSPSARSCGSCATTSPTCPTASARRSSCASSTGSATPRSATVLDLTPAAVKQAIFEARTALFSCREGREMACHDVRRMLSDGDGRDAARPRRARAPALVSRTAGASRATSSTVRPRCGCSRRRCRPWRARRRCSRSCSAARRR